MNHASIGITSIIFLSISVDSESDASWKRKMQHRYVLTRKLSLVYTLPSVNIIQQVYAAAIAPSTVGSSQIPLSARQARSAGVPQSRRHCQTSRRRRAAGVTASECCSPVKQVRSGPSWPGSPGSGVTRARHGRRVGGPGAPGPRRGRTGRPVWKPSCPPRHRRRHRRCCGCCSGGGCGAPGLARLAR